MQKPLVFFVLSYSKQSYRGNQAGNREMLREYFTFVDDYRVIQRSTISPVVEGYLFDVVAIGDVVVVVVKETDDVLNTIGVEKFHEMT